ncbi:FixH family protein [Aliiroseovarius crassostreae]|uniref:FixH family protein n=1 Tax=Aliiroseovarius crassostreae TaxID=154981 RepID=UPI00220518B0|nr:FixH family protein [Aliiroseovarius crassostreae]UWP92768.1 FixH family protein [Aliiroseovarius crassostreae]UWP99082.1 FixH family protein [Aliiroseovarius crassostreae]
MSEPTEKKEFELTGKHVLAITVSAFAVIIGVNIYMAYSAINTFPGLETDNSYVASQQFDRMKEGQLGLGWDVSAKVEGETLVLDIRDEDGRAVEVKSIYAIFGRATHVRDDQEPNFSQSSSGAYTAAVGALDYGNWNLRVNILSKEDVPFQQRIQIYIPKTS